jgi:hypothetical protein
MEAEEEMQTALSTMEIQSDQAMSIPLQGAWLRAGVSSG